MARQESKEESASEIFMNNYTTKGKSSLADAAMAGLIVGFLLLMCFIGVKWMLTPSNPESKLQTATERAPEPVEAWAIATQYVEKNADAWLTCPATLTQPWAFDKKWARRTGKDTFTISCHFDSQNEFGATIRKHYTCKVKRLPSGQWEVSEFKIP